MATKKKASSRLSKAEKEMLARRAAGQLKRKATLEAKKRAAAKLPVHTSDEQSVVSVAEVQNAMSTLLQSISLFNAKINALSAQID